MEGQREGGHEERALWIFSATFRRWMLFAVSLLYKTEVDTLFTLYCILSYTYVEWLWKAESKVESI